MSDITRVVSAEKEREIYELHAQRIPSLRSNVPPLVSVVSGSSSHSSDTQKSIQHAWSDIYALCTGISHMAHAGLSSHERPSSEEYARLAQMSIQMSRCVYELNPIPQIVHSDPSSISKRNDVASLISSSDAANKIAIVPATTSAGTRKKQSESPNVGVEEQIATNSTSLNINVPSLAAQSRRRGRKRTASSFPSTTASNLAQPSTMGVREKSVSKARSARKRKRGCESADGKCSFCGESNTPEWRKDAEGRHTLCNACGLRFARQQNKKSKPSKKQGRPNKKSRVAPASPAAIRRASASTIDKAVAESESSSHGLIVAKNDSLHDEMRKIMSSSKAVGNGSLGVLGQ